MLTVRAFLATAALALFLVPGAAAQVPTSLPVLTAAETENARVEAALSNKVSLEADNFPLKDVLQSLAKQAKITIVLTRKIEDAGVSPDQPVTKEFKDISLRSMLRLILDDLNLTYMVKDEVLKITTIEDGQSPENLLLKIYPVKDLVFATENEANGLPKHDFDPLIELITSSIEPDSWQDVGGPGFIGGFSNASSLVIRQRTDIHEQIAALLTTLRKAKALQDNSTTPAK
jgi:type II secretory pathway component GspD/PulD (secretin)